MAKKKNIKDVEVEEVEKVEETESENIRKKRKINRDYDEVKDVKEEKKKIKEEKRHQETYFEGVRKEMKKVQWAKGSEVLKNSLAVIVFILIFVGFFELIDVLAALLKGWLS